MKKGHIDFFLTEICIKKELDCEKLAKPLLKAKSYEFTRQFSKY